MTRIRKPTVERICRKCGATFFEWPFAIKKGQGNFCSRQCSRPAAFAKRTKTLINRRKPVRQPAHDGWRLISTNQSSVVKVSIEDFDWATSIAWVDAGRGYVLNRHKSMHRRVMERVLGRDLSSEEEVDHINQDKKDNRRENLRLSSRSENARNFKPSRANTSGFRGVSRCSQTRRWRGTVIIQGTRVDVGRFETAEEAAWMRDQWAIELHGEFAHLNFSYQ